MDPGGDELVKIVAGHVSRRQVVVALQAAAMTFQLHDWLLTLGREVKYIWSASWNWSKVLYILTRYVPFVTIALVLRNHFSINPTPMSCKMSLSATSWLAIIGMDFAEIVLAVRTYAVWKRDKRIGIGLALLILLYQIPNAITLHKFIEELGFAQNPYPEVYLGCFFTKATRIVYANWVALTIVEGVVLVLMIISAVKAYREGASNLMHIVYRDGIRFYLYIFCVTLGNVLITLLLPIDFVGVGSNIEIVFHSILACRLMIGIREAGHSNGHNPETFELSGVPHHSNGGLAFARGTSGEGTYVDRPGSSYATSATLASRP